ncbi:hypothetical protein XELAEV_18002420mg [Xenopus laevis]|nr:hypothetical protein XELAEV_18002420mg [Xenopus laevis]
MRRASPPMAWRATPPHRYSYRTLEQNIWLSAKHVPGYQNCLADILSHFQFAKFRELAREAVQEKQLAGISFFIKMLGATDLTNAPVIKQIYRGIARVNVSREDRRPITMNILRKMSVALEVICSSLYEVKLFQGLFLVMYFAALRISEAVMYVNWGQPDIIVNHLGGNDIGRMRTIELIRNMRRYVAQLNFTFLDTIISWSEVVSRRVWLYDIQHRPHERCRRKLNFAVAKFLRSLNMSTYRHQELALGVEGLFRTDGVHLSDIGNDIFNTGLQTIIEKAIFINGGVPRLLS